MNLRYHYHLLLLALSFFTRVPVRLPDEVTPAMLHQASRYFAVIGLFIGAVSALAYELSALVFSSEIAVLIAMAAGLLLTGAFHEDGWADVWDGFGGGWTVKQKLTIMKDSRIGTYGGAALFILLMMKYQSLLALSNHVSVVAALVLAHTLSRVVATSLIFTMSYVSEEATSKVKPLAQHLSVNGLLVLIGTGSLVVLMLCPWLSLAWFDVFLLVATLFVTRTLLALWFKRQLGGYTGDCLGAAQQASEVVIYLFLLSTSINSVNSSFIEGLL